MLVIPGAKSAAQQKSMNNRESCPRNYSTAA
jgi:hypothetical protein